MFGSENQESFNPSPKETSSKTFPYINENPQKIEEEPPTVYQGVNFEELTISSLIEEINCTDIQRQYSGVNALNRLLSNEEDDVPIQEILHSGVVSTLIHLFESSLDSKIQSEASFCLVSLCSGTSQEVQIVVEQGVIPSFISGLKSPDDDIVDASFQGLGNIVCDSGELRDLVIEYSGIEPMVKILEKTKDIFVKRHGIWALSNCCKGKPMVSFEIIERLAPVFCEFLKNENDAEILADVALGLSFVTQRDEGVDVLFQNNINSRLVSLLEHPSISVVRCCLRTIAHITAGNEQQTAIFLQEEDLLPNIFNLFDCQVDEIKRNALWAISNITAGTPVQFESIMGNPDFVGKIIETAKDDHPEVSREAAHVLSNSTANCTPAQIIRVMENGVYSCLLDLLYSNDKEALLATLEGIRNCLKWGKEFNLKDENGVDKFMSQLVESGGLRLIEQLQAHPSEQVYEIVSQLIEEHFVG